MERLLPWYDVVSSLACNSQPPLGEPGCLFITNVYTTHIFDDFRTHTKIVSGIFTEFYVAVSILARMSHVTDLVLLVFKRFSAKTPRVAKCWLRIRTGGEFFFFCYFFCFVLLFVLFSHTCTKLFWECKRKDESWEHILSIVFCKQPLWFSHNRFWKLYEMR